jgi:hypothetical protein
VVSGFIRPLHGIVAEHSDTSAMLALLRGGARSASVMKRQRVSTLPHAVTARKTSWQRSHFRILEIPFDTMRAQNFTRSAMRIISSSLIDVLAIEMLKLPTTAF